VWSEIFEIVIGNMLLASKLVCTWVVIEWLDTVTMSHAAHLYIALAFKVSSCS